MKKRTAITSAPPPDGERILSYHEVERITDLDRTTIWREVARKRFPPPLQLTPSRKGWRWTAVMSWMDAREASPIVARLYHRPAKGVVNARKKSAGADSPEAA